MSHDVFCNEDEVFETPAFFFTSMSACLSFTLFPRMDFSHLLLVEFWQAAIGDIQTCLVTCRKSFRVTHAMLLRRFRKISCNFRGRRSTLDVPIVILRGRRSTLDVSRCVFLRIALSCRAASSSDKVQFRGRRGIL